MNDTGNERPTGGRHKAAIRSGSVPPRSPKKPEPAFATTEEMVAITNVERQTLRQWIKRGLLPPVPGHLIHVILGRDPSGVWAMA